MKVSCGAKISTLGPRVTLTILSLVKHGISILIDAFMADMVMVTSLTDKLLKWEM